MNATATYSERVAPFYNPYFLSARQPMTTHLRDGRVIGYLLPSHSNDYLKCYEFALGNQMRTRSLPQDVVDERIGYVRQLESAASVNGLPGFVNKLKELPGGAVPESDIHRNALEYVKEGFGKFVPIPAASFFDEEAVCFVPQDSWIWNLTGVFGFVGENSVTPNNLGGHNVPIAVDGGYVPLIFIHSDLGLLYTMKVIFHEAHHGLFTNGGTFMLENNCGQSDLYKILVEGACEELAQNIMRGLVYRDEEFMAKHKDLVAPSRFSLFPHSYIDECRFFNSLCGTISGAAAVASFLGNGDHEDLSKYYGKNWGTLLQICANIENPVVRKPGFLLLEESAKNSDALNKWDELLK